MAKEFINTLEIGKKTEMGRTREAVQNDIDAQVEYLFSHSFNHTLHVYIDITGDLIAGTLLSQIMYWFSESANKGIRARIYKDGHYWIAKRREDWMQEIRISKKQYDCAIKKLTVEGNALVEVKKYQFNGIPVTHIRLITENINRATDKWKSDLAESIAAQYNNGCNGSLPNLIVRLRMHLLNLRDPKSQNQRRIQRK